MKAVYLKWATMLALLLMISACGSAPSSSSDSRNTSAVTIKVSQQTQARKAVVKSATALASLSALRITVSAADFYHVYPDVPLTGGSTVQTTILVPNGVQRTFRVEILDGAGLPAYFGSTTTDLDGSPIGLAVDASNPLYTVTYTGNGNSGGSAPLDPTRYMPTQTVTVLDNTGALVKSGYSFAGWNTQANGSGTTYTQAQTFAMGTANVTLYAIWTANPTATVIYNGNGATSGAVPVDATHYQPGQSVTVLGNTGNLVQSGYSFTGWNTLANGSGTTYTPAQTFTMGAANVTLYAMWSTSPAFSVTYNGNGATSGAVPVDATNYQPGQAVTVRGNTGNLVRSGYSFTGWNTLAGGLGTTYTPAQTFTMGSANISLYAMWAANPTHSVIYNGNGATSGAAPLDATNYQLGQTVTVLGNTGNLYNGGYAFSGWNTQADGLGTTYMPAQNFTMGAANITLYAMWTAIPTFTVTYDGNGATSGTVPVDFIHYAQGDMVSVSTNTGSLANPGLSFSGWNTLANGRGTTYSPAQTFAMGAVNVTLYAVWVIPPTYSVSYNGNGSDGGSVPVDGSSYLTGQTVTVLANTGSLVKSGATFTGWNTLANGTGTSYTFAAAAPTFPMGAANVTLYAMWSVNPTYTVTYNGNGATSGAVPVDSTSYLTGQTVTVLGNTGTLAKTGATFAGWNTLADGTGTSYTFAAAAPTFPMGSANVTLYAMWSASTTYTVTYVGNGATSGVVPVDSTNYLPGQTATVLWNTGNLLNNGYSFAGWNTQANGSGTTYMQSQTFPVAAGNVTLYAFWTVPRFAFVANGPDNSVSAYALDATSGRLKFIGKAAAGINPTSVTVDPSGKYVYVANNDYFGSTISQYTIGADGMLTPMTPATLVTGANPDSVTVDPSGRYAYVASSGASSLVFQYTIGATGQLTPFTTPLYVGTGSTPYSITVDPSGRYAYVANNGSWNISQYTIDANGVLTPMTPFFVATDSYPNSITVDPSGKYAYVANSGSGDISQYTIGATGALTPMTTATVAAGSKPYSVTVAPSGKYAYVADFVDNNVRQYTISATDGSLTAMTTATVPAGTSPYSVTVDPSGKFAYAMNSGNGSVSLYTISADGSLSPNAPNTIATPLGPYSMAISRGAAPVVAVAKYAYVANQFSNDISQYTIGGTGALSFMIPATVAAGTGPRSVTADPSGKYAYAANFGTNNISQYTINANGTLAPMATATVAAGTGPFSITVDPSGRYAYAGNGSSNNVSQYTIGANGTLAPMVTATVAAGTTPISVTVDPSGKYAYVANFSSNTVSQYSLSLGALIPMATATVATGVNPYSITVDPTGRYAYAANNGSGTVSQYSIGATGALSPMAPATVGAGTSPIAVTIAPLGQYAYVANNGSNNVSQYTIGAGGALAAMTPATVAGGLSPQAVTVDPSGKYAYVGNWSGNNVSQYSIGASGTLNAMTPATAAAGGGVWSVTTVGSYQ